MKKIVIVKHHIQLTRRLIRDSEWKNSAVALFYGGLASYYLTKPDHDKAQKIANKLICKKILIGHYYLANSDFLFARYEQAENELKQITGYETIADCVFLLVDIFYRTNRFNEAWTLLENLARVNKRKKIWLYMARLVKNKEDSIRFQANIDYVRENTNFLKKDELLSAKTDALMRAGLSEQAIKLWQNQEKSKPSSLSYAMDQKLARVALEDLKSALDNNNIIFFLISGTLLGCIREKNFLANDKDIDVGVWDTHNYDELVMAVSGSGCFYIIKNRTKNIVQIRHVNGINIDIFVHHREENDYWHAALKLKWHNTPFTLMEWQFLGKNYLIPTDYDLYLTENYGDWKTPKTKFDSTYDTPNAEVINQAEFLLYQQRRYRF